MAKESSKDVRLSPAQMVQPGMNQIAQADVPETSTSGEDNLEDEYHYVIADLRRIGVIAVVMLAILIALVLLLP